MVQRDKDPVGASFEMALQLAVEHHLDHEAEDSKQIVYYPEYVRDPVGFFVDVCGVRPYKGRDDTDVEGQFELLESLVDNRFQLIFAGTGLGKTWWLGRVFAWFMCTRKNAIGVTVATTWDQVVNQLWREIRETWGNSRRPLPGKCLTHSLEIAEKWYGIGLSPRNPETLAGYHAQIPIAESVLSVREQWREMTNEEYFKLDDGQSPDDQAAVLLIIDEASGVDDELHNAGEGILTNPGSMCLKSGNLTRTTGRFFEMWKKYPTSTKNRVRFPEEQEALDAAAAAADETVLIGSGDQEEAHGLIVPARLAVATTDSEADEQQWKATRWTAFDAPDAIVDRKSILRMRQECGNNYESNPRYMVKALALPPLGSDLCVYPLGLLEECKDLRPGRGGRHVGIDLGFGGGDPSVATLFVDGRAASVFTWNVAGAVLDVIDAATVIFKLATGCTRTVDALNIGRKDKGWDITPRNVHIDATGAGAPVVEVLRKMFRFYADPVVLSEKPQHDWAHNLGVAPYKLKNRRQELHWILLRLFQEGMLSIPDRPEYGRHWADLCAIQFATEGLDEFQVEKKQHFVAREGRSPDFSDSVLLAQSRSDPARVRFRTVRRLGRGRR